MPKKTGRLQEMNYPYLTRGLKKQIAYIFDTNKCIACQTCTMACKVTWTTGKGRSMYSGTMWNQNLGYYPLNGMRILNLLGLKWEGYMQADPM